MPARPRANPPSTAKAQDAIPERQRTIRRYPNRRLYDTQTSAYVSLDDLKALVVQAIPFCVRDAKTGADLTRSILLQILLEQESAGIPIFSRPGPAGAGRLHVRTIEPMAG
jgi:polyhydroxyalkanoate synthesis regulator protein